MMKILKEASIAQLEEIIFENKTNAIFKKFISMNTDKDHDPKIIVLKEYLDRKMLENIEFEIDFLHLLSDLCKRHPKPFSQIVEGFIGEAAIANLISNDLLKKMFYEIEYDWAKEQLNLRLKLNQFMLDLENYELLDDLLSSRRSWPIKQVIGELSIHSLQILLEKIEIKKPFYKRDRNILIQQIKRYIRKK